MKILIICHCEPWQSVAASSIIKGLQERFDNLHLSWSTSLESACLFRYNNNIKNLYEGNIDIHEKYNIAINLIPSSYGNSLIKNIDAEKKLGFINCEGNCQALNDEANEVLSIFQGEKTHRNFFQIIYKVANITWKGEGYNLAYYPRNKMKKRKTGVAISNDNLREYVKNNLNLNLSELWHVPIRKNLLKRIDEINRVKRLITDDLFSAHIGIAMRKHVEFIDVNDLNMSIEFFGKGNHYRITHVFKEL